MGSDSGRLGLPRLRRARETGFREARFLKRGAALALLLLLSGCSAVKFGYNRLDWIASWQIGRFVDLQPPQKAIFEARFRQVWQWHRGTQLPLYAHDLRELADAVAKPLTAPQIAGWLARGQAHAARTLQEFVPGTASVLRTFNDAQVHELLESMAEKRRDEAKKSAKLDTEALRDKAEEEMTDALKPWIGSLTPEQKQRVHAWSREREYAGSVWQQYEDAWASAFTAVLAHRAQPDFQEELSAFFDHGHVPYAEEMERLDEHNRQLWIATMADLSVTLTPDQRSKMQKRLRDLAVQFDELADESRQAALPALLG